MGSLEPNQVLLDHRQDFGTSESCAYRFAHMMAILLRGQLLNQFFGQVCSRCPELRHISSCWQSEISKTHFAWFLRQPLLSLVCLIFILTARGVWGLGFGVWGLGFG